MSVFCNFCDCVAACVSSSLDFPVAVLPSSQISATWWVQLHQKIIQNMEAKHTKTWPFFLINQNVDEGPVSFSEKNILLNLLMDEVYSHQCHLGLCYSLRLFSVSFSVLCGNLHQCDTTDRCRRRKTSYRVTVNKDDISDHSPAQCEIISGHRKRHTSEPQSRPLCCRIVVVWGFE